MYNYIVGVITNILSNSVVLENNGIGYQIYTANPFSFSINSEIKIYVYQVVREDELTLYGFKTVEEKELFLKLISVKGLGPKMALPILAMGSIEGISDAIEKENILYLKKFPKIGDKVARQIILDLKGKLTEQSNIQLNDNQDELTEVLLGLGYKMVDIKRILPNVSKELEIGNRVKEALKLLMK